MTFNTEDKNSDELLQEIKALRKDIQSFLGYMGSLYFMIKDLAEYDYGKSSDGELARRALYDLARTALYDLGGLDKEDV